MSLAKRRRWNGAAGLDLLEEAVALWRQAPVTALLAYYLGAVPFWLGALFFLSDMSQNAYAASTVVDWSLGLALLYIWKKVWQTVCAAQLRATLAGRPDEPWTVRRALRMIATQAAWQPWGMLVRFIAAVVTLPFFWATAFFQNITVLGDGSEHVETVRSRALTQARLWPGQGHLVLGVLMIFTLFVWFNIAAAIGTVPSLLKSLLGVETAYSRSGWALANTTVFATTVALTSLAVDPLRKAVFVLRCFRGAALRSGDDLAAELRAIRRRAVAIAALLLLSVPLHGADAPAAPLEPAPASAKAQSEAAELDQRIGEVLERREFAWRSPRQKAEHSESEHESMFGKWLSNAAKSLDKFVSAVFRQLGRAFRWLEDWLSPKNAPTLPKAGTPSIDWVGLGRALLALLVAILIGVLGFLLWRIWRQRRTRPKVVMAAPISRPDLRSEDVVADQLPEDGWLQMARDHVERGELVLALRAAWLATLAHLGQRSLIGIARHKSNRDYERELQRRARDRQPLLSAFGDNRLAFERSWYGEHEVTRETYSAFEANFQRIRQA